MAWSWVPQYAPVRTTPTKAKLPSREPINRWQAASSKPPHSKEALRPSAMSFSLDLASLSFRAECALHEIQNLRGPGRILIKIIVSGRYWYAKVRIVSSRFPHYSRTVMVDGEVEYSKSSAWKEACFGLNMCCYFCRRAVWKRDMKSLEVTWQRA